MSALLDMGGHGAYVWAAWGVAVAVLGALAAVSVRAMRARERELARREAAAPPRRGRAGGGGA